MNAEDAADPTPGLAPGLVLALLKHVEAMTKPAALLSIGVMNLIVSTMAVFSAAVTLTTVSWIISKHCLLLKQPVSLPVSVTLI